MVDIAIDAADATVVAVRAADVVAIAASMPVAAADPFVVSFVLLFLLLPLLRQCLLL